MADEQGDRPHIVVHCRRGSDRTLIGGLLEEIGADWSPLGPPSWLGQLMSDDRVDLALADVEGGNHRLDGLLRAMEAREHHESPPLILLARPRRLSAPLRRAAHRFHAHVVPRPFGKVQLASAIHSGLALRARQRGHRRLRGQLRRCEALVERLRRETQEDARKRTQLLAAISHNLRTPVNEIVLFCQVAQGMARDPDGPAHVERLAAGLLSSVASLRELVDDLLDIARYDLGALEFHESVFPLGPFLDRTLAMARTLAQGKGLPFAVEVDDPERLLRTDPDPLARVLQNLASNAVKFTDVGEVRVRAQAEPGRGLVLSVRDTGRGIAPEQRAIIFDEFAMLHNPERDRAKGIGLGLAICRRLVEALRGRIEVTSDPGRGSTFSVTLPPEVLVASP
jgi:signal transduction histidine kinase